MRNLTEDAIAALRRGDQGKAFALLRTRLTQDPQDAVAWLWLSEATPDLSRKVEALERFLALAPSHPRVPSARARLSHLQSRLGVPSSAKRAPITMDVVEPLPSPLPPSDAAMHEPEAARQTTARQLPNTEPSRAHTPPLPAAAPPRETTTTATPPMDAHATAPYVYHPAIPGLLQSLLDTAPMPRVRTDLPGALPQVPARRSEKEAEEHPESDEPAVSVTEPQSAPSEASAVRERVTPWWAWTLLFLMVVQIGLMVYIILRIETLLASVP